jgi:hypothetical protein
MTFDLLQPQEVARRESDPKWLRRELRCALWRDWLLLVGLIAAFAGLPAPAICWFGILSLRFYVAVGKLLWGLATLATTGAAYAAYIALDWLFVHTGIASLPAAGTDAAIIYAGLFGSLFGALMSHGGALDYQAERRIRDIEATTQISGQ